MPVINPKYTIFYDFHTIPNHPSVGERFNVDEAVAAWKDCGIDYVIFHARCNMGMAYYNTKIGIRHHSLKYDLFGSLAESCKRNGIAIGAYFNVGLSHEEGLLHREWLSIKEDGRIYGQNRMDNFMRRMCYNTGYGDHLIGMIQEVVANYPISGLFFDCFSPSCCVGVECVREMKERGIDWGDHAQVESFAIFSQVRLANRIKEAVCAIKSDLLMFFNGVDYELQSKIGNYIEYECLPTGGWGYEILPVYSRYLRTLGKPVLNMTGRFHGSWGDFGGIRTAESLEYDCISGIAHGMRPSIGDHWHPRGDFNKEVLSLIGKIYKRVSVLDPYIDAAVADVEVAVVAGSSASGPIFDDAVLGAVRMLAELKIQFDVVTEGSVWGDYRLLVLPDNVILEGKLKSIVMAHLGRGGCVLASGWAGMNSNKNQFAMQAEWGVRYIADDPVMGSEYENLPKAAVPYPAFFLPGAMLGQGLPDMVLNCYVNGVVLEAMPGSEVLAHTVAPFFNRHWDGEHHYCYLAPDAPSNRPFAVRHGNIIHFSHPVFSAYHRQAAIPVKGMIGNAINALVPDPIVRCYGLPSFARVSIIKNESTSVVFITAYVPERRGPHIDMIEDVIDVTDVTICLRVDQVKVSGIIDAHTGKALPLSYDGKYVKTIVSRIRGWTALIVNK